MRKQPDYDDPNQFFRTSNQYLQTPKVANRPNIPIDTSRRSTTPTRIQERVSNSPLKTPLQNAINKASRVNGNDFQRTSININKGLGKSSRRDQSPIVSMAKKMYYEQDPQTQQYKAHPQTSNFIKKYFETMNCQVPLQRFIQKIMQEFETLWGTQNADKIFDDFTYKIADIFGSDYIDLRQLVRLTKQDGMIGLILRIFKQIKNQQNTRSSNHVSFSQNPQIVNISRSFQQKLIQNQSTSGLKNVIQEFMQSMYQAMQNQIYQKFNIQMRRMIIKYRQTQKILKKVNQKINSYADVFDFDQKLKQKQKKYQKIIQDLNKQKQKIIYDNQKQKQLYTIEKKEKDKLQQQIIKLKQTLQKYQNVVLNKAMQNSSTQPSLLRQNSNLSRVLSDRVPLQPMRTSQINTAQPFKITIDTHVVHKQNMPPQTKTVTTFHNPLPTPSTSQISLNPIMNPLQRQSYQPSRTVNFRTSTSPFSTSRVTTYRPLSPTPLSPYQSRITRPL